MTEEAWLSKHPYLQSIAELHFVIESVMTEVLTARATVRNWGNYVDDFHRGVPLLQSSSVAPDLKPVQTALVLVLEKLTSRLPTDLADESRALTAELQSDPVAPKRVIDWLLGQGTFDSAHSGLLRFVGWQAMIRYLRTLTNAFATWRNEERWLRSYCPMCGSPPAMAQLIVVDTGRQRFLVCGHCETRWRYPRTGCPFCEANDDHNLAVLSIKGEGGLRIDYCHTCSAYLKTYDGIANQPFLLADWTSIHLDFIAGDRGLQRKAASLYDLEVKDTML